MGTEARRSTRDGWIVFAVAVVPRLVYLLQLRLGSPTFFAPEGGDSILYDRLAQGESGLERAYFHSPLYQWFLTALYEVFGRNLTVVRVVQHLLGASTAVGVQRITLHLWRRRGLALGAGLAGALYGPALFYEGHLVVDALLPLLVVGAAYGLLEFVEHPDSGWGPVAGALVGVAALGRATALVFVPVVLLVGWTRLGPAGPRRRRVAALLLGTTVVIAPVTLRNYVVERDFVLITSNGGLNLYIGNNPRANATYNLPTGMYFEAGDPADDFSGTKTARDHLGYVPSSSELSRWWTKRALQYAVEHPARTVVLVLEKASLLLGDFEYPQLYHYYVYAEVAGILRFLPTSGVILVPGLLGLAIALRRNRHTSVRLYAIATVAYGASFLPFFIVGRYRSPWAVMVLPFAAWGVAHLVAAWRRGRRRRLAGLMAAVVGLALVSFPRWGHVPNPAHQYYGFGRAAAARGDTVAARSWLERAIERDPRLEVAQARLAELRREAGDAAGAERGVVQALAERPESARLHRILGELRLHRGAVEEAEVALRRSVRQGPADPTAWTALGRALEAGGKPAEARSAYRSALRLLPKPDPDHPAAEGLGRLGAPVR